MANWEKLAKGRTMSKKLKTISEVTAANRIAWNNSAAFHKGCDSWNQLVKGFSAGNYSTLDSILSECLVDLEISGKSVVQIGCNNGRETLSLKKLGAANCTGIDQSEAFIEQARELCNVAGENCTFICADFYDLPKEATGKADIALITIGVLNWMPDLPLFFKIAASLINSGGALVIYETHPYLEMFDPQSEIPHTPTISYFKKEPFVETEAIVYDGQKPETDTPHYWHIYTVGDILNACIKSGLIIEEFTEYPHTIRETDYDIYKDQVAQLPMCYALVAKKS